MELRRAKLEDLESIYRLHVKSIIGLCREYYSAGQIEAWTGVLKPQIYESAIQEKTFLVAVSDGELSGIGILDHINHEISAIYVDPDCVGQRIGSSVLSEFENLAIELDMSRLRVHSTLNAKGFYLLSGYKIISNTSHELPNGVCLECIEMEKEIS